MADELLTNKERLGIRIYNVGLGDCIYVRVPDKDKQVHILIDCGNKYGTIDVLKEAIANVEINLPIEPGSQTRVLDLLVVTHPHQDHLKGFEPAFFKNIKIKNLWLSPAFREDIEDPLPAPPTTPSLHSNSLRAMQSTAQDALNRLIKVAPAGEIREYLEDVLLNLGTDQAIAVLNGKNDGLQLDVEKRRYVSSDFSYDGGSFTKNDFESDLKAIFKDRTTKITILGPVGDISTYLPKKTATPQDTTTPPLPEPEELTGATGNQDREVYDRKDRPEIVHTPRNISIQDFDLLRNSLLGNGLALAAEVGRAANNLSVVLLLEWKDYRLLFPGDAEWENTETELEPENAQSNNDRNARRKDSGNKPKLKLKDANNGSWNVMWNTRTELSKPVDFLKVGHHGSENATPWARTAERDSPINVILDHILPEPKKDIKPTARAVVSTHEVKMWPTIPDPEVLRAIGKRVCNTMGFKKDFRFEKDDREKYSIYGGATELLPERTDRRILSPENRDELPEKLPAEPWIDVFFPPLS